MEDERNEFQQRIGVGERQHLYGRHVGTIRHRPVVADDGPLRGHVVGSQTDHWSGRVDATIKRATTVVNKSFADKVRDQHHKEKSPA